MSQTNPNPVTQLLDAAANGNKDAKKDLWAVIYDELHRMAHQQMLGEAPGRTLQSTALVHEAYLKLFANDDIQWENRRHFFGAASRAMRQILIDDARRRRRGKRGGGVKPGQLLEEPATFDSEPALVLALDEALTELEKEDKRKGEVVQLRYFAGLTEEETANALEISRRTVQLDWRFARAWLNRKLSTCD